MSEMNVKVGRFDKASRTVRVTFTSGDIVHERRVNACLKPDGSHDSKATKARIAEVASGVAVKIGLGVIGAPKVEEEAIKAE